MKEFEARTPKQLDTCLRLLYAENVKFIVNLREMSNKKFIYVITAAADDQTVEIIKEKYRILIS